MAKSRKPDRPQKTQGRPPLADATLDERTSYLLDEIGQGARFLEEWIVHYLAELLGRAEDRTSSAHARSDARAAIAQLIPHLWEQQIAREALRVRQSVDYWLRRTDTIDREAEEVLVTLLASPKRTANFAESKLPYVLRALCSLTELSTRLLTTSALAERTGSDVTSDALRRFLQRDEEVTGLQAALARVIPSFGTLDPTDSDAVEELVYKTLLATAQAQLTLLKRAARDPLPLNEGQEATRQDEADLTDFRRSQTSEVARKNLA